MRALDRARHGFADIASFLRPHTTLRITPRLEARDANYACHAIIFMIAMMTAGATRC